ncbi:CU044_2847 family protein [Streptomyces sp. NPDC056468]|uniref:CU044_2847 family protein n=1 Tax=Streptomyces sp. NPDC056468 TaxID=3345830 RepID=UPI0036C32AFD
MLDERAGADATAGDETAVVSVTVEGHPLYLSVRRLESGQAGADEREIAASRPTLEEALDSLVGVARAVGTRLQQTGSQKATVELACEFAVESGTLVAVLGKATARSTFKVALEWAAPAP